MAYLSQIASVELKGYLPLVLANMVDQYAMTVATIKTEYYEAVITGDLNHVKWLQSKYPSERKSTDYMAELALSRQFFDMFDHLTEKHGDYMSFGHCHPLANMEHLKRCVGKLYVDDDLDDKENDDDFLLMVFRMDKSYIDNPLILDLPNVTKYIEHHLQHVVEYCIEKNLVNVLYALLHKPQYRTKLLNMPQLKDLLTKRYYHRKVAENLICAIVCDFFGVECVKWLSCESYNYWEEATIANKWCQEHDPNDIKCDYIFSPQEASRSQRCNMRATNGTKCEACHHKLMCRIAGANEHI